MFSRQLSGVIGRAGRTLSRLTLDDVRVRGNLYFIAAPLPRSHRILARQVAVKGLRDLADDLAPIFQVANSLCVYHALFWYSMPEIGSIESNLANAKLIQNQDKL